jgi:dTDP-glucose 4,6-dehydratase
MPLFITNAIDDQPLPVYGSGLNRRDWIHVEDHCAALVTLLEQAGIEGETFNIGAGNELDVLTITDRLLSLLGKPRTLIRHVEDRPGHDRRYALDCSRIQRLTGWAPKIAFEEGLRDTVAWYTQNESWWRPIKQGEFRAYYERTYGQRRVLKAVQA